MKRFFMMFVVCIAASTTHDLKAAEHFEVANDGNVTAIFTGATASYINQLTVNFNDKYTHHSSISNRSNIGDIFDFGTHAAGTKAEFIDYVEDTKNWWHLNESLNNDGFNHMFYSQNYTSNGVPFITIGFEDLRGGGDLDFNDITANFYNMQIANSVPEPSTYLMLIFGIGLLFLNARNS